MSQFLLVKDTAIINVDQVISVKLAAADSTNADGEPDSLAVLSMRNDTTIKIAGKVGLRVWEWFYQRADRECDV